MMKNLILIFCAFVYMGVLVAQSPSIKIDSNGNVGIGIAEPTEKLEVNGSASFYGNSIKLGINQDFEFIRTVAG